MKFTQFGRKTGLRVSELCLGTGNFGTGWGHGAEPEEAKRIFDAYVRAGGNFIDTANGYQRGQSEELVGKFIKSDRDNLVVATKYTNPTMPGAGPSATGNSRKNMVRSLEESLKRLNTDHIDLYWAHISDGMTPMDEILRAFDDLVSSGKILYAGLSNFPAWRIARAELLAESRNWAPVTSIQVEYSLAERTADRELLPMADALGLAITTWSPLGGGFLTGKYRAGSDDTRLTKLGMLVHTEATERETHLLDTLTAIAHETDTSPTQVSIAWLLAKASVSSTALLPILGPRTVAQLDETLAAVELVLEDGQLDRLDAASSVPLGVPHVQIAGSRKSVSGNQDIEVKRSPC